MKKNGFTLFEVLVAISIIIIFTGIVLLNYRATGNQLALQRAVFKLAADIRRVQEMAISSKEISGVGVPSGGYGIYFRNANDTFYLIYADTNPPLSGNEQYDGGDTTVENNIELEKGVEISTLSPANSLSINFKPPDPAVKIKTGMGESDETIITLRLITDTSKTKTIKVNKAGRIEIID